MSDALVTVEDLEVHFATDAGLVRAVDGVSFAIPRGQTLAVVGESGSGKSVTSLALMRLVAPPGRIAGGSLRVDGRDLRASSDAGMREFRGREIGMIFQEPMTSLNPVRTIGHQIAEAVVLHQKVSSDRAWKTAVDMLDLVGIPDPAKRAEAYPHQMSGGMRQRAMIAMALCCRPKLLIADEPTTALDVTIQAQILELMRGLQRDIGMSILFITHDLGVVAEMADRVVVMYAGRAVEEASVEHIFARPLMPYTRGLLNSIPRLDRAGGTRRRLEAIPGNVPNPLRLPAGCSFHPRCAGARAECVSAIPPLEAANPGHRVRCVRWAALSGEVVA